MKTVDACLPLISSFQIWCQRRALAGTTVSFQAKTATLITTATSDSGRQDLPDADAAGAHGDELVLARQEAEADQAARQNGDGRHLGDDERDAVEEEPDDRARPGVVRRKLSKRSKKSAST